MVGTKGLVGGTAGKVVLLGAVFILVASVTMGAITSYSNAKARTNRNTLYDSAAIDAKLNLKDSDSDQVPDVKENRLLSTDRLVDDSDGDGMPDAWESSFGLNPNDAQDGKQDPDRDGLTNAQEYAVSYNLLKARGFGQAFDPSKGLSPLNPDTDGDKLPDGWEVAYGLDPLQASGLKDDPDGDGLTNFEEFQHHSDPTKFDTDGDGISDGTEVNNYHTDPALRDTDGDGMPDDWEVANHLDARDPNDRFLDPDGDGLLNIQEYKANTDPHQLDTDGDGMPDGWEFDNGLDPHNSADGHADPDADGLSNTDEYRTRFSLYQQSTDPHKADTDGDGLLDGEEQLHGTNPFRADTDLDGLTDGDEIHLYGTNPLTKDTDGDTISDGDEIFVSKTDPKVFDTDGDGISDGDEYAYWQVRMDEARQELQATGHVSDFVRLAFPGADQDTLIAQFGPQGDPDKDGLPNIRDPDSDGDGLTDGTEIHLTAAECSTTGTGGRDGSDPVNDDTDLDHMPDGWEYDNHLDPCNPKDANEDPDGDGVVLYAKPGTNATIRVSPPDRQRPAAYSQLILGGLPKYTNLMEYQNKTNPHMPDTDCDGMPDGWEVYFRRSDPVSHQLEPDPHTSDGGLDPDKDGFDYTGPNNQRDGKVTDVENFTNLEEWYFFTDPWDNNTDHATFTDPRPPHHVTFVNDGTEVYLGEDPRNNTLATVGLEGNGRALLDLAQQSRGKGGCQERYDLIGLNLQSLGGPLPVALPPAPPRGPAGGAALPILLAIALPLLGALAVRRLRPSRRLLYGGSDAAPWIGW